jgi:dTDP-4-dehydrorhamnose reductase
MKILLTGGTGQLGTELLKLHRYTAPTHEEMDICHADEVSRTLDDEQPELIVHAAAFTNTFGADRSPSAAALCWQVNVLGTRNLINAAQCPIILISTEAVIDPYCFYILTKLQAEYEIRHHAPGYSIFRTSFREDPYEHPQAFVDMWTIGDSVSIIAKLINEAVQAPLVPGIRWIGTGPKTMYELAKRTVPDVTPVPRSAYGERLPSLEQLRHIDSGR